jgi:GNAT superfamily N-acetyltransferase
MELRTLRRDEISAWLDLLGGFEPADGLRGRELSARALEADPRFRPKQVWVAVDDGQLIATVQLFPRRMRLLGHSVPCGGIGSVFTHQDRRREGVATRLLSRAVEELRGAAVELALSFATPASAGLFERHGFACWQQERVMIRRGKRKPRESREIAAPLADFSAPRDLESVVAIHSGYSASRSGTLVRDQTAWQVSLLLAGNPDEHFRVALRDARPVAYLRSSVLSGGPTVLELARLDDAADELAALVSDAIDRLGEGLMLPSFDDLPLTVAIEQAGNSCLPAVRQAAMMCCLDAGALAARLDVTRLPDEDEPTFLERILPADRFVFWPADRF